MKNKNKLELRMYGLVPYNISPIQQGIQFGHAVVEYAQKHFKDKDYQEWAWRWKTFIILNGGTTNSERGSMQKHLVELEKNKIKFATFYEPDLNDTLTAIVFLVDESVFNKEKYPDRDFDFLDFPDGKFQRKFGKQNYFLRTEFLPQFKLA